LCCRENHVQQQGEKRPENVLLSNCLLNKWSINNTVQSQAKKYFKKEVLEGIKTMLTTDNP
jgi:hypothetical protein